MFRMLFLLLAAYLAVPAAAKQVRTDVLFDIDGPVSPTMQAPYDHLAVLVATHPREEVRVQFPRFMRERKFVVAWDLSLPGTMSNAPTFGFSFPTNINHPLYREETLVFNLSSQILMDSEVPLGDKQCSLLHEWIHLKVKIEKGRPYVSPDMYMGDKMTEEGAREVFMAELVAYYEEVLFAKEIHHIMHDEIHKAFRCDGLLGLQAAVARERIASGHVPREFVPFLEKLVKIPQIKERK